MNTCLFPEQQTDTITTQFTMTTLEELGLLKMDFLGLRTLTVIQNAVRQAEKRLPDVRLIWITLITMIKQCWNPLEPVRQTACSSWKAAGMKSFMKELKPREPGGYHRRNLPVPAGSHGFYSQVFEGKKRSRRLHHLRLSRSWSPFWSPTYGCIVYQEQVMQIVRDLAGYTLGRSDLVRRAMSKKKAAVMEKERQNFVYGNEEEGVKGCIANGIR